MLDNVRKYAMEKFAGDQTAVDQFVEGFIKEAMANPSGAKTSDPAQVEHNKLTREMDAKKFNLDHDLKTGFGPLRTGFMNEAGKGVGNLLLTLGVAGVGNVYKGIHRKNLHGRFLNSLEKAINTNENIQNADRAKVMDYANTVFKFAPNVATDVNVLSAVVSNAIQGDVIDTNIIKALTDLEGRYTENFSFSPKTYI